MNILIFSFLLSPAKVFGDRSALGSAVLLLYRALFFCLRELSVQKYFCIFVGLDDRFMQ